MRNLELDLAQTHARTCDPPTSHSAARQAEPLAKSHCAAIEAYLKRIHPCEATADEIAIATKIPRHAVLKRLPDLQVKQIAEPTDRKRIMKSGRFGRTWRIL